MISLNDIQPEYRIIKISILFFFLSFVSSVSANDFKIIGAWNSSDSKENFKIFIAEEDDDTILFKKYDGGIRIRQVIVETQVGDQKYYYPAEENAQEYYSIDKTGHLLIWNESGLQETLMGDEK